MARVSVPQFLALCIEAEARPGDGVAPVALTHSRHGWPGPMQMSLTQREVEELVT